jgi:HlyD family secretion protein
VERDRALVKQSAMPELQLEQAETESRMQTSELESLRFAEKVAAHAVDEARLALQSFSAKGGSGEQLELTSPIHGVVLHVMHENAGVVPAGEPLLELGDPASLEVVVQVLSQDAVSIRPNMSATLTHWGGNGEIQAHVRRVEPAAFTHLSVLGVEEQRVNVLLDIDQSGAAGKLVGDGFALEARILTWSADDVAQIPTSALFHQGDGWAVFAVRDGRSVVRPVKIGHRGPLMAEVLEGLGPGETVIVHPPPTLKPGASVRPRPS